jgi:hypothetical protein
LTAGAQIDHCGQFFFVFISLPRVPGPLAHISHSYVEKEKKKRKKKKEKEIMIYIKSLSNKAVCFLFSDMNFIKSIGELYKE